MPPLSEITGFTEITPTAPIAAERHGGRAKCLQRLIRLDMPVPRTMVLDFAAVRALSRGDMPDLDAMLARFGPGPMVSVRPSSEDPDWGGPGAVLNIGMNDARHAELVESHGEAAANALYLRFIQAYSAQVARLDPDDFSTGKPSAAAVAAALAAYEDEMDEPFPQDVGTQLGEVLRAMARAWEGTSARLLRQAKGAPADAGLGLVVQQMVLGVGRKVSGSGVVQFVDGQTGAPAIRGRYMCQAQGRDALTAENGHGEVMYLARDARGRSIEDELPETWQALKAYGALSRGRLREEMQIEFTIENGKLWILDAVRVQRSTRAGLAIAVALAEDGIISREEAVLRVPPRSLSELLHFQVDPEGAREVIATGIPASPGAATGRIVFSSRAAQAMAAQDESCVLVRRETGPEDIRGMHAARAVLTERGGITSHAAVIARGLGVPCVVGASELVLDARGLTLTTAEGRVFREGEVITVDGTSGRAFAGAVPMLAPELGEAFQALLAWADAARDIGVRANADTPEDARKAAMFAAEGVGLCRTEHMFFAENRLLAMREMLFADTSEDRRTILERILPMQREDFIELFDVMRGKPVTIRLFDLPLHEFLPQSREGLRELAEALDLPLADVTRRAEALSEVNPMLGMRGVRLGLTVPEIYDMQARAIFEAVIEAARAGEAVVPEVMIPLVSANREVEIVKARIDAVAASVRIEQGADFDYRLGVMVETPRAALRAGEIAPHAAFLSFGTNDLTQMTYGLSRDDAGRFMGAYVAQGVYEEDPFHTLDLDGVGELVTIGAERGRAANPGVTLSLCGEHGGDPASIAFCRAAGFDYVSCSPYRVPVARLAAAHFAILARGAERPERMR